MRAQPVDRRGALLRRGALSCIGKAGRKGDLPRQSDPYLNAFVERLAMAPINARNPIPQARQVRA